MKANEGGWTTKQRQFMVWLSSPRELREDQNERIYALKHKVGTATLWRWKQLPGFWSEVQELSKLYLSDAVPEGLEALKDAVRRGSFQHLKLYFEMVGLYVPKIAPTTPDGKRPYGSLSDDELQQRIDREITTLVGAARSAE